MRVTEKWIILEIGSIIFINELDMEGEKKREIKPRWFMQFCLEQQSTNASENAQVWVSNILSS